MKDYQKKKLNDFVHENKQYEKEVKQVLQEMFESENKIVEDFKTAHSDYNPKALDGGYTKTVIENSKRYFKKIEQLKKKYNISD